MKNNNSSISENLLQASSALADNLLHSEPMMLFKLAEKQFDNDPLASNLFRKLSQAQAEMRKRQTRNAVSEEDLEELRNLQYQVRANQTIQEYDNAQLAAMSYIQEINQEISALIGFDFCSFARRSGCC